MRTDCLPHIDVIIPTTCESSRWQSLQRAIASVQCQLGVRPRVVVVVNGTRFDPASFRQLGEMKDLEVIYREIGGVSGAQKLGRTQVTAPFFAFLDDDDEYLPGGLAARLQPLLESDSIDFVVSNGYDHCAGEDYLRIEDVATVQRDPLRALLSENWLASCGGLFRSDRIPSDYFDGETNYFEWTWLAYRLMTERSMRFVDVPTFRVHDSPGSASKSMEYRLAEVMVLEKIAALSLPADVLARLRIKRGKALHGLADYFRSRGMSRLAWRYHLASLFNADGWRYLAYSRKLLPVWPK